jgi:hypothetical protein
MNAFGLEAGVNAASFSRRVSGLLSTIRLYPSFGKRGFTGVSSDFMTG